MTRALWWIVALFCAVPPLAAYGAPTPTQAKTVCPRFPVGSTLSQPEDLFSTHGLLRVHLTYRTRVDSTGTVFYCYTLPDGTQSPTLHVHPGDELVITLKNEVPASVTPSPMPDMAMPAPARPDLEVTGQKPAVCGSGDMTATSTNMHFHGTNTAPTCHQDEVIRTMVNSGDSFQYDIHFPLNEPPGLYWYHPHIHGISEPAVQGGASGAIIVDGIENMAPEVAGLPQQVLIVRDNLPTGQDDENGSSAPAWDLSLNYTPVPYPQYSPVVIPMRHGQKQFWRLLNASADTILDLQLQYDGVVQPLHIVALDGVPTNSQDGASQSEPIKRDHLRIPPAGRVEFIVTPPGPHVKQAQLVTLQVDTGPDGDSDPLRPLAAIKAGPKVANPVQVMPAVSGALVTPARFANLRQAAPTTHRKLYFSEVLSDPNNPDSPTNFYITVDGQKPVLFSPANPPAITTTQGAVEDWTIENRALENHEFHIHQIHFLVLKKNGLPVDGEYLDTIDVPYWSGSGPYPSVTLRMDFRGDVTGDFVYHCHILGHEDSGMMAIIRVLPKP